MSAVEIAEAPVLRVNAASQEDALLEQVDGGALSPQKDGKGGAGVTATPVDGADSLHSSDPVRADRLLVFRKLRAHLRPYLLCGIFASVSAFCFGFDTGSIGPIIAMDQFTSAFDVHSPTIQGLLVSSILLTASLSSALAGPLSDRISRTHTAALGGIVFCAGSALCASSPTGAAGLRMLFAGRMIAGVGEGLFISTTTVYILEIAPTSIRGRLSCTAQLFVTLGLASGYFVAYASVRLPSSFAWRVLFVVQAVVSAIFALGALFLPHSPRWLAHVGREADAARTWARLGYTAAEVEKEGEVLQREEEASAGGNRRRGSTLRAMFAKDVRRRTILGVFLMSMNQACGIDGVLYYAPILFKQAGLSSTTAAFLASGVSGLLNVVCTIVSQIFMDSWGRRPSMIYGGTIITFCMLTIGTLYASGATDAASGRWAVVGLIYVFVVAFASTWAVVNRIYCSEIQPMRTRAATTSLGQCANWVVNWIIAFTTPLFLAHSSSGPYFLFGACALLTVVACVLFQPESRGVSLEALDTLFASASADGVGKVRWAVARVRTRASMWIGPGHAADVPVPLRPLEAGVGV